MHGGCTAPFDANAHTISRGTSALFAALAVCKLLLFAFAGSASPLPRNPEALSPLQFALAACLPIMPVLTPALQRQAKQAPPPSKLSIGVTAQILLFFLCCASISHLNPKSYLAALMCALGLYSNLAAMMNLQCVLLSAVNVPSAIPFDKPWLGGSFANFWRRWNLSVGLPLRQVHDIVSSTVALHVSGVSEFMQPACGLFAAFLASAALHTYVLDSMVFGSRDEFIRQMLFFLMQPLLILGERSFNLKRLPRRLRMIVTLTLQLAIGKSLFINPFIKSQMVQLYSSNALSFLSSIKRGGLE